MKAIAAAALASATFAVTAPALAEEFRGTAEAQQVCTPDVFRLCGQFIPDSGQITACLARQKARLSYECHKVFAAGPR